MPRKMMFILIGSLVVAAAIAWSCDDEGPAVNSTCKSFCQTLVDAMEDSEDYFYISSHSDTLESCEVSCTQTMDELDSSDVSDVQDCLECMADNGSGDYDDFMSALYDDCADSCGEVNDNEEVWSDQFWNDFSEDFDENYSSGDPDLDSDVDADADADIDADADADGDTDGNCSSAAVDACSEEYSTCASDCGTDSGCAEDCYYVDFCNCITEAGCDPSTYGCN
ncbi:MAG: hypothetical protein R6V85_08890 [Polyangia bacterium]